ncbi:MAG: porin [Proteobacteria bacterium]|nr:porin [Pseudomonadota bacterium]
MKASLWAAVFPILSLSAVARADDPPAETMPTALPTPSMNATLAGNPNPLSIDLGPFGKTWVGGAVSLLAFEQSHSLSSPDKDGRIDIGNAQVFLQKTDGVLQYFVQLGGYSFPTVGTPYLKAADTVTALYGYAPVAYLKLAPNAAFSLQLGKLPTLIGAEYSFGFQNLNIERGLLWNQENVVTRGAQANYTSGPIALSLAVTDGFYSNRYSWISGSLAWTFDAANILSVIAGGNTRRTAYTSSATPLLLNNEQICNVFYTHIAGPWTWQTYLQYSRVPKASRIGTTKEASTWGGAVFANYQVSPSFNLAGRIEYLSTNGDALDGTPNLLYGPGSTAWSATITPTWQWQRFFVRAEVSLVKASGVVPGLAFGRSGTQASQTRALVETGALF